MFLCFEQTEFPLLVVLIDHHTNFHMCFCFPAENLKATLSSKACSPSSHSSDSDTDSVFPLSPSTPLQPPSDSETSPETLEAAEGSWNDAFVPESPTLSQKQDTNDIEFKVQHIFWCIDPIKLHGPVI